MISLLNKLAATLLLAKNSLDEWKGGRGGEVIQSK